MKEVKFNSQVCTTREQSKRLLELGLKPETADCQYAALVIDWQGRSISSPKWRFYDHNKSFIVQNFEQMECVPTWSLHRLISLMPDYIHFDAFEDTKYYLTLHPHCLLKVLYKQDVGNWLYGSESSNLFDALIDVIENLILGQHFNKQNLN